jgi:hypothetical protein
MTWKGRDSELDSFLLLFFFRSPFFFYKNQIKDTKGRNITNLKESLEQEVPFMLQRAGQTCSESRGSANGGTGAGASNMIADAIEVLIYFSTLTACTSVCV